MPDYGVRAETWEPLPWSWAAQKLTNGRNYWVITVSPTGMPHALPVWGVWDEGTHRFMFSSAPGARKARNIAGNPQVGVATDDTVECLSIQGHAELVVEDAHRRRWAQAFLDKYQRLSPDLTVDFVLGGRIFEVTPLVAFGVIERAEEFATRPTRWRFTD